MFHPTLQSLAQTLLAIPLTHDLGNELNTLAYKMTLSQTELLPYTEKIQKLIPSYQSALAQLKDTPDILKEFIQDCSTFSTGHLPAEVPTYEDFLEHNGIQIVKRQSTILTTLYKLTPQLFDGSNEINLMPLLQKYTGILTTLNTHMTAVQALLPASEALRKDITTFTDTITEMQSNKMMAVNWNSQKANFVKIRQELDTRRTDFVQKEESLNQGIAATYTALLSLHSDFQEHSPLLLGLFERLLENASPSAQIITQRSQINQIIVSLVGVQNNLLSYANLL
ncbi:MAG: hypothetical protein ACRDDX_05895 [Cellulosilyticaceae bacterium]